MGQKPRNISLLESLIISEINELLSVSEHDAKWLSKESGVPESTLSKTLNGKRSTSLEELDLLTTALGAKLSVVISAAESRLSHSADNLLPFPTTPAPVLEFTPEIAARAAAKTPPRYRDGYTTEHGIDYDNLGLESQDPQDWE